MICSTPDFCKNAVNVYRTKHHIVKQNVTIETTVSGENIVFSEDAYYERTKLRDRQYECIFAARKRIDGKRLPSTSFSRKYVK